MRRQKLTVLISDNVSNWQHVSGMKFHHNDVPYIVDITTEPPAKVHVSDCDFVGMPDLAVGNSNFGHMPADRSVIINRYPKSYQAAMLKAMAAKKNGEYPDMIQIPTWSLPGTLYHNTPLVNGFKYPLKLEDHRNYVIRPEQGARGMAQIVFTAGSQEGQFTALGIIEMVSGYVSKQDANETAVTNPEDKAKDEVVAALLPATITPEKKENFFAKKSFPPGVRVYVGDADHEEANRIFSTNGIVIQEVIDNIAAEYRLIVGPNGRINVIMVRPRGKEKNSGEYEAVTSGKDRLLVGPDTTGVLFKKYEPIGDVALGENIAQPLRVSLSGVVHHSVSEQVSDIARQIATFLANNAKTFEYNSVDLFITKNGKWGFFEFSNQFSTNDMGETTATYVHQRWMRDLLIEKVLT